MKEATVSKKVTPQEDVSQDTKPSVLKEVPVQRDARPKLIGEVFQSLREKQDKSVREIADILHISERYLQAIESASIQNLPERVYTLGFVRSYAHYLGVDPQKSVDQFKKEVYGEETSSRLSGYEGVQDEDGQKPSMTLVLMSGLGILLVGGAWYFMSDITNTIQSFFS